MRASLYENIPLLSQLKPFLLPGAHFYLSVSFSSFPGTPPHLSLPLPFLKPRSVSGPTDPQILAVSLPSEPHTPSNPDLRLSWTLSLLKFAPASFRWSSFEHLYRNPLIFTALLATNSNATTKNLLDSCSGDPGEAGELKLYQFHQDTQLLGIPPITFTASITIIILSWMGRRCVEATRLDLWRARCPCSEGRWV